MCKTIPSVHNPSLTTLPRNQPAPVISSSPNESILEWLEAIGRLIEGDDKEEVAVRSDDDEWDALIKPYSEESRVMICGIDLDEW